MAKAHSFTPFSSPLPYWLAGAVLLANLFVLALAGESLRTSWTHYNAQVDTATSNMSQALADNIKGIFLKTNIALVAVAEEYNRQLASGGIDGPSFNAYLDNLLEMLSPINSLRVADAGGAVMYGTGGTVGNNVNVAERDYFIKARDGDKREFIISSPKIGYIGNMWLVVFALRINNPRQGFAGVVYATVHLDEFNKLFSAFEIGKLGAISLRDQDAGLIVRQPEYEDRLISVGSKKVSQELREALLSRAIAGTYHAHSTTDNIPRTLSYRKIDNSSWYVLVGLAREEFLAHWWEEVSKTAVLVALFMAGTLCLARLFYLHWKGQAASAMALAVQETRFREVVEGTDNLVTQVDGSGRFTYVNPVARKIFGLESEECVGRRFLDFVHAEDQEATASAMAGWVREHLTNAKIVNRLVSQSGDVRHLSSTINLHYAPDGSLASIDSIAQDVTERIQAEETLKKAKEAAETANKAKTSFLANMSHEIRTPLNGIMGMLQLIELTSKDENQKEWLVAAKKSSKRLTQLLSDILDLSRIESDKLSLREGEFPPNAIKNPLTELFTISAEEKSLSLDFKFDERLPLMLIGDENRVLQIMFNLVGNAIKFTNSGTVRVEVSQLSYDSQSRVHILFAISDTGIGISSDLAKEIFEPFVQGDPTYTKRFPGAGLGLPIVRKLVIMMGGTLCIDSTMGEGTTVYVSLPFKLPSIQQKQAEPIISASRESIEKSRLRILLVEDDDLNRKTGELMLEKSGYTVVTAEDGQEAYEKLSNLDFDLIIMDIQMPVMNGLEATKAIRYSVKLGEKAKIPIIAMTAYAMSGDKEEFISAGMNDYIAKPVDMAELEEAIKHVLTKQ